MLGRRVGVYRADLCHWAGLRLRMIAGAGQSRARVQTVLSNWRDAWPNLVPDRQERGGGEGEVENTAIRELDREGLEQAGLTLRVLDGRTAGNCRIEQTAPREDRARLQKNCLDVARRRTQHLPLLGS